MGEQLERPMTIRLPAKLVDRIDALVPVMEKVPDLDWTTVNRSVVMRFALQKGVEYLEKKYGRRTR